MQALTLDHAKSLLRDSASVLDAALDSGLSGPGRLHDLFVTHEAMSPGEWKNGGAGMTLRYGFHPSPFGTAIVIASGRGLAGLAFADPGGEQASLADMQRRWPRATYLEDRADTEALAQRIFDTRMWRADQPLRVVLIGTDFEVRVWETLLKIRWAARCPIRISRAASAAPRRHAQSAPRSGRTRCHSWCRAIARSQERRADRLSLGHHPQAGDAGLGSRTSGRALTEDRVSKANGSRECAPDDKLRVPTASTCENSVVEWWARREAPLLRLVLTPDRASRRRWRRH